jgi:hypothetical protein
MRSPVLTALKVQEVAAAEQEPVRPLICAEAGTAAQSSNNSGSSRFIIGNQFGT